MLSALQAYCMIKSQFTEQCPQQQNQHRMSIESILRPYKLDNDTYKRICALILENMERGLNKAQHAKAIVKMFPTYVRALPDGSERGNFLALDLGGTNFRVLLITLNGTKVEMQNKIYAISEALMTGKGTALFDHIAHCIADFMETHKLKGQKLPLGFTFSFPCKQHGLAKGTLVTWTKGFNCEGVEGEDVVRLLHEAVKRRDDIEVECVALLNDTVGCLMSCAFADHDCEIGVILGTGTNACYMERTDRVGTWDGDDKEPKQVIINTEWGAFGSDGCIDFIRTDVDHNVDENSINPREQIFEKMISGMYMGEIARQIVVKCVSEGLLFKGTMSKTLDTRGKFYTKYVSEIEDDSEHEDFIKTKQILDELEIDEFTADDCRNLQSICAAVSRRAAFLASAGIATLLNRINKPKITVAVDGSLYRFHPHFHDLMIEKTTELLNPGIKHKIMLAQDGSGRGAALVAAVTTKWNNNH